MIPAATILPRSPALSPSGYRANPPKHYSSSTMHLVSALAPDDIALTQWPLPYQAKVWIYTRRHEEGFIGNPVRHYQHLASRMSGPNKELRAWRAWACFHLAQSILPADEFPVDQRQIEKEQLEIPIWDKVLVQLNRIGSPAETDILRALSC